MPPKKVVEEEVLGPWALGRFSSNLKVGIVGMPNVGKSTLYNALTNCSIPAENFPFCTIEPNSTRVNVPDARFDYLVDMHKPKSVVQPFLEVVDIAGLVKGASSGAGLGNAFLSHIKAVDGIMHVMRCFEDADVIHVEDRVDPVEDIEIITSELRIKDLEYMTGIKEKLEKEMSRSANAMAQKETKLELDSVLKIVAWLEEGKEIRHGMEQWTSNDVMYLNKYQLLTAKPVIYLVNLSRKDYERKKNKFLVKIHEWVKAHGGGTIIPFSAEVESELQGVEDADKEQWQKDNGVTTALPKIITTAFSAVHLIYFFTAGPDEVKAWCIRKGYKAPQAAGAIHTDFERGFICAEVMSFDDLKELGSEQAVKAAGKYKQQGKEYVMEDGLIVFFKFNVSGAKKK
uniref:Obg-like ATPase 1 n=1 Tax=Ostreococcus mediterraneus TaxID=1486918 RepID=A0A6U0B7V5_9CHLO|mmetsp:Transcript_1124/g.4136  ORF Transcript_1124/g.4136 Transcript_1124/m.4136 type:complete len:400 (+) Transcript_1124:1319-2518(+)